MDFRWCPGPQRPLPVPPPEGEEPRRQSYKTALISEKKTFQTDKPPSTSAETPPEPSQTASSHHRERGGSLKPPAATKRRGEAPLHPGDICATSSLQQGDGRAASRLLKMPFSVNGILCTVVLLVLWRTEELAEACSCAPVHPQQAFCNADVGESSCCCLPALQLHIWLLLRATAHTHDPCWWRHDQSWSLK